MLFLFSFECYGNSFSLDETGAYFKDYSASELQKTFQDLYYETYIDLPNNEYPRLFAKNLPHDLSLMDDQSERNRLFMQILMPIILKVNEEVLEERELVLALEEDFALHQDFDEPDMYFIEELAKKYDVTTPLKDTRRYIKMLSDLKKKVDIVPPSIVLSAAAIYTNWGTSRVAQLANNLFKYKLWYTDEGLKPLEDKAEPYRYKIYDSLEDSIRDYVLKINSNINYEIFRQSRLISRKNGSVLFGKRMDWGMILDSNLQNYAGLLDYTLTYYKLYHLDDATLEDSYDWKDE